MFRLRDMFERFSPRTIRVVYSVAAAVVMIASLTNFLNITVYNATSNDQCAWRVIDKDLTKLLITDVVPGGVADRAGIKDGDLLLKVNGKSFENSGQAQAMINRVPRGDYATYQISRNGVVFETKIQILKVFEIAYLTLFTLGLGSLLVGYVVVMTKPQGRVQRLFGRYGIAAMLLFGFFSRNNPASSGLLTSLFIVGTSLGRIIAPAMFVTFFFHFPVRKKILDHKWVVPSLYATGILLLAALIVGNRMSLPFEVLAAILYSPFLFYFAGLLVFAHSYLTLVDPDKRPQLRPILIAVPLGAVAAMYTTVISIVNPFAIFLNPSLFIPGLLILAIPIAFGYSIFRYRLMDIDLIVKRSLIYGVVTASTAAIYLLTVVGIGNLLSYFMGTEENEVLNVFAFILIALAFDPIKRRAQDWIDRLFYHERYNYQKALLEFSQELPGLMNLEQILNSVVNRISGTMHVDKVAVLLCDETEGCSCVSKDIPQIYCTFMESDNGLIELLRQTRGPVTLAFLGEEGDRTRLNQEDKGKVVDSGIVLSVPMFLKDRLIGTMNVGPKKSGKMYSQEDIDLLSTVASQAAIAIENARLHRSELEKHRMEEELNIARRIQQGLLPKSNPQIEGLEISGISIPAQSVGGDYYDFIRLPDNKLLVVVADVSGKGMSAALYMSKIQGMIQLAAHMYASPKEMLVEVNRRIYDGIERKSFITMILGLFDLRKREVIMCRAGHNKALVSSNGDVRYASAGGIGLGLEHGPLFERYLEEVAEPLTDGKMFVFYSDGLSEAMNIQRDQFGEDAVHRIVEARKDAPVVELQNSILSAVESFRGSAEPHDDITLVIVRSSLGN